VLDERVPDGIVVNRGERGVVVISVGGSSLPCGAVEGGAEAGVRHVAVGLGVGGLAFRLCCAGERSVAGRLEVACGGGGGCGRGCCVEVGVHERRRAMGWSVLTVNNCIKVRL
jgi:hypothetical protein